jgi:hypothetical protein
MSVVIPSLRAAVAVPGWAKNVLWRNARAVPSLDLRFADNKSLVDAVTGASLITFTRASSGTYVDSAGVLKTAAIDVPRFDHNPTTGESLGLLVEEQRTNLLLRSEEFDNASWIKSALLAFGSGSTANAIAGPSGAVSADLLTEDTATTEHFAEQNFNTISGTTYAFSVFVKAGANKTTVVLRLTTAAWSGGANNQVRFNLSTGASTIIVGSPVAFSQNFGNGWWRFTIVSTASSTGTPAARIHLTDSSGNTSYTGDGTSGIYLWGADLQAGAFPTSYIPTTTAAVTRSADVASITGTAFSGWYRQDEGTMFANWSYPVTPSSFPRIWQSTEGAAGAENAFSISTNLFNHNRFGIKAQNVVLFDSQVSPDAAVNQSMRSVMAIKAGQHACVSNGAAPLTNTGAMPSGIDRCYIGSLNGGLFFTGHIRRLVYWGQRLPNNVLQAITQ